MALSVCHNSVTSWVLPVETACPIYSFGYQTWNTTAFFCCVETFTVPFISFHQTFPHVFHYFGWCETLSKNAKIMTCPKMMQDGYGGDTKFHPWRYPGKAPVKDACGVTAGGTAPLGQLDPPPGETTGAAGKTLPPLLEETVWIAGSEAEATKGLKGVE